MNTNGQATISVFGAKPEGAILVPDMAFGLRNDCKRGLWTDGSKTYGDELSMTIIKFSKFYGDLGQTTAEFWGQVWFLVESGTAPKDTVLVTYLKKESLGNFNKTIVRVQSEGIEPAQGMFIPKFAQRSGKHGDYYALEWDWKPEHHDPSVLEKAIAVFNNNEQYSKLKDELGTAKMVCIDNLTSESIEQIKASWQPEDIAALPPGM